MNRNLGARELTGMQQRSAQQQDGAPPRMQITPSDDDDDFVEPPRRAALLEKRVNIIQKPPTTAKLLMKPNKYIRPPTVRCAPAIFNSFVDHLTMNQRRKIRGMGFSGLLQISAEGLESRDLLQFLMDRLNPMNMEIDLGKERTLEITPSVVDKVFRLPLGGGDIPAPTKTQSSQALIKFRELIHVEPNQPVKSDYLQKLLETGMIDDDLAVKFFFIIAFNKLLFPDTSNYIRGKDVFAVQDFSEYFDLDWCRAVVDNLRDASLSWHADREKLVNKSISGCSILLIIFYLDNLRCQHQINHTQIPRAKFFNKSVIEQIMKADRTIDKDGKVTFGKLQLRNRYATCYYGTEPKPPSVPSGAGDAAADYCFPSIQAELSALVDRVPSMTRKRELSLAFSAFDSQTENALNYINKGQFMLLDAHHKVISTLKQTLEKEMNENICEDTGERPTTRRKNSREAVGITQLGHDYDAGFAVPANVHTEPPRVRDDLKQPSRTMDDKPLNSSSPNQDVEFVVSANGHADPVSDGQLLAVKLEPNTMQDVAIKSDSRKEDPVTDGELLQLTQQPKTMEDIPITNDSHKEEDAASLVDTLIGMIDSYVDSESCPDLRPADPLQTTDSLPQDSVGALADGREENIDNGSVPVRPGCEFDHHVNEKLGNNNTEGSTDSTDDQLGPVLMRLCTQEESQLQKSIAATTKRITKVPGRYISPFKGTIARPKVSSTKAIAVRKKFCKSLKSSRDLFITVGSSAYSGVEIFESFGNDDTSNILSSSFMSTYVQCMSHDDERNMPDGGGYRVFLLPELVEMINILEHGEELEWPFEAAQTMLQRSLTQIAPQKVKLYFFPVLGNEHWSVYCINMIHKRIDILDSDAANNALYHEVLGDRIIPRLNEVFQQVTSGGVKNFASWRRPLRHMAEQARENDSGFFAARFMEFWDGDSLTTPVYPDKITQIRSELLFYLLYHPLNETKKLPAGLEAFRPRL